MKLWIVSGFNEREGLWDSMVIAAASEESAFAFSVPQLGGDPDKYKIEHIGEHIKEEESVVHGSFFDF